MFCITHLISILINLHIKKYLFTFSFYFLSTVCMYGMCVLFIHLYIFTREIYWANFWHIGLQWHFCILCQTLSNGTFSVDVQAIIYKRLAETLCIHNCTPNNWKASAWNFPKTAVLHLVNFPCKLVLYIYIILVKLFFKWIIWLVLIFACVEGAYFLYI